MSDDTRRRVEREIVEWMRERAARRKRDIGLYAHAAQWSMALELCADAIERGDHRKPARDGEAAQQARQGGQEGR